MLSRRLALLTPSRRVNRGYVLDADPTWRGTVLDANALNGRTQSWDNDPPSADRVGRYRVGGPFMAATDKTFASIFTFTRASQATGFGADGSLVTLAADAIRQGYDPATLLPAGWLIEGSQISASGAVNTIRNPRGEGAIAGTPGTMPNNWFTGQPAGITRSVVGRGTEFGMDYNDLRFFGTSTAAGSCAVGFDGSTTTAAVTGQTWSAGASCRLVGGSLAGLTSYNLTLSEYNSGTFVTGANYAQSALSATMQRWAATRLFIGGASINGAQFTWNAVLPSGATIDYTVRLYAPQLEQNYYASSIILPPAAAPAATVRAPDSQRITGGVFTAMLGSGAPQGCIIFDVLPGQAAPATGGQVIAQLDDGTDNNRILLNNASGGLTVTGDVISGGVAAGPTASAGSLVVGTAARVGLRWGGNKISVCLNGGTLQSLTAARPVGLTNLRIGNRVALDRAWNSRIRLARALAYAPSDTEFQARCVLGA